MKMILPRATYPSLIHGNYRKVYQVLPDDKAADEGYLRIVDESGEDYLYPKSYFISVELPRKVQDALRIPR